MTHFSSSGFFPSWSQHCPKFYWEHLSNSQNWIYLENCLHFILWKKNHWGFLVHEKQYWKYVWIILPPNSWWVYFQPIGGFSSKLDPIVKPRSRQWHCQNQEWWKSKKCNWLKSWPLWLNPRLSSSWVWPAWVMYSCRKLGARSRLGLSISVTTCNLFQPAPPSIRWLFAWKQSYGGIQGDESWTWGSAKCLLVCNLLWIHKWWATGRSPSFR